jgi:hypothetical protein
MVSSYGVGMVMCAIVVCASPACVGPVCGGVDGERFAPAVMVQPPRRIERLSRRTVLGLYGQPYSIVEYDLGSVAWRYFADRGGSSFEDKPVKVMWEVKFEGEALGRIVFPEGLSTRDYWVTRREIEDRKR